MAADQTMTEDVFLQQYQAEADSFSVLAETRHLFSIGIAKLFLYPVHLLKQRLATRSVFFTECKKLPQFRALWKTIQGGSFAYNTMLLGITPLHKAASRTLMADLTCLAILFGDEFIDGISQATGKAFIARLIKGNKEHFYLRYKAENGKTILYYHFDVRQLIDAALLENVNEKYAISYNRFYDLLLLLLEDINQQLSKLPQHFAEATAQRITGVCNACFDTYIHDIEDGPVQHNSGNSAELLHFHTQKNQPVQYQLLELRCLLAKQLHVMEHPSIEGWLNIISVMQYYDDMLDAAADDEYQDNIFLNIARQKFDDEWNWFKENKHLLVNAATIAGTLSVHMPCSVHACMKLISRMVQQMDWQQQKICNYLLRKNWFVTGANSINLSGPAIHSLYHNIASKMKGRVGAVEIKAYLADACFHSEVLRQRLFAGSTWAEAYEMRLNMLSMSIDKKCRIFDKAFSVKD